MLAAPRPRAVPARLVPGVVLAFFAFLAAFLLLERAWAPPGVRWALLGSLGGFALWFAWLFARARRTGRALSIEVMVRRPHLVQMVLHTSVYVYWGLHWENVATQAPLILAQVAFAYLFDLALCFTRYGNFRLGFGQVPIVGSTNLFLWFKDPLYGFQLAMIAGSILAREYLKWTRDGQKVHIFNPSAISLCVAAVFLLSAGAVHLSWGPEISVTLGYGQFSYEQIFLAGVIAQLFFGVTWVTASAALTVVGLTALYTALTGGHFFVDTTIPIAVFLGMTLLVTDPVSSPYSLGGKVIFGALYGVSVMALYLPLRAIEHGAVVGPGGVVEPAFTAAFFDKLLQVPLLNLCVRWIDRLGRRMNLERLNFGLTGYAQRAAHVGVWVLAFFAVRGTLKDHPGRDPAFWRAACEAPEAERRPEACDNFTRVLGGLCEKGAAEACHNLGVVYEFGEAGVKADASVAAGAYDRACDGGAAEGCNHLGGLLMTQSERADGPRLARDLFVRACDMGSAGGCARAAVVATQGLGGPVDAALAARARAQGCAAGDAEACKPSGGR